MSYAVHALPGRARLADAHAVRRAVFVEEQGVSEAEEMDGRDGAAEHLVVYDRAAPRPVATARVRDAGAAKIERVAVRAAYRGRGLGRRLMGLVESLARVRGHEEARLHAQTAVEGFYAALGYETTSGEFREADIPHVKMRKPL